MDDFLRSLADAFGRNRASWPGALATALALLAAVLVLALAAALRRRRARAARLARLAARHGLGPDDLALARALAASERLGAEDVLTRLDVFERATARALARRGPPVAADALAMAIGRLRRALGFDRLPAHAPLLTSRELAPGVAVSVDGAPGRVTSADERAFTVELSGAPSATREVAALDVVHAREARYRLRCPVLARRAAAGGAAWVLGHDEAPERVQHRAFVRAAVTADLELSPREPWPGDPSPRDVVARVVDLSAGGAFVTAPRPLPVGALLSASFTLGAERFAGLRAVVLACEAGTSPRVHLEFGPMPDAERDRLAAAVVRTAT